MRPRDLILPAVAAVLSLAILGHLIANRPDPAAWPRCEYFRCRDCGGPASIDPEQPERWGCPACGFSTFKLCERFYTATRANLEEEDLQEAITEAGVISRGGTSLMELYQATR